jgi:seryl-tRNA synthetase
VFDIKWIRDNAAAFNEGLKRRGLEEPKAVDLIALDDKRRATLTTLQDAQSRRNAASKEIGKAKGAKDEATASKLMAEVAALKDQIAKGEEDERKLDAEIKAALEVIPNLPRADVPDGKDEKDNAEVRKVGTPGKFDFAPRQHFEIGEALGLMDFEAAQKISGARFVVLKGALARLERAIGSFMLDLHTGESGYVEHNPPLLVRTQSAYGTGNLPKFADDLFRTEIASQAKLVEAIVEAVDGWIDQQINMADLLLERDKVNRDDLEKFALDHIRSRASNLLDQNTRWLIPTAEVSLTNLVRESIIEEAQLPMRLTAWTPCFRSEAGAAGRDTRGMIRQHQFSKV